MEKKEKKNRKLLIRREMLRELNPAELIPVAGGRSRAGLTDVSNCCCDPQTPTCP
jgi:hypothetical protein